MSQPERKSRKPENTAFKQQRLKSWQPILTPKSVLPSLFILGAVFAPLGGFLLSYSDQISEISIDYTDCYRFTNFTAIEDRYFHSSFPTSSDLKIKKPIYKSTVSKIEGNPNNIQVPKCTIQFSIPDDIKFPVYLYYELTNFYQNHRSYVKSVSWPQLTGDTDLNLDKIKTCRPLEGKQVGDEFIPYYPCGLIANSIFNDTVIGFFLPDTSENAYTFDSKDISLASDKAFYKKNPYELNKILPPPFWVDSYPNGTYTEEFPPPDLSQDTHLQVWLRIAGLPKFRKLYGKNTKDVMKKGTYEIQVFMKYDIHQYGGRKSLVITTVGNLGGKNSFLGFTYIIMSVLCVLLGIIFTARHFYKPRKLGDHTYLSWNQSQGQTQT